MKRKSALKRKTPLAHSGNTRRSPMPRKTIFDYVESAERESIQNKYCAKSVLQDEASVEQFFVARLLTDLGYEDAEIRPKSTLQEIAVPRGRSKENFRPDYAIVARDKPRWVIDAKGSEEDVDKWAYQTSGYAHALNQQFEGENPCQYHAVTNGYVLKVFKWDDAREVLDLDFADFEEDNSKFVALRSLLGASAARKGWKEPNVIPELVLEKPSIESVKRAFNSCHRLIWKAEKMNPQPAFVEFVKIMFVKLLEDRKLHEDKELGPKIIAGKPIPKDRLVFSIPWVEAREREGTASPVDKILFRKVVEILQDAVERGKKKPIFAPDERIKLQIGTIKQVVTKLQHLDMFSIDEDLNGRLFETFLSATMRGQDLGQRVANESIFGIDAGSDPPLAKIARINMYLHGDGGSRIYAADGLDKSVRTDVASEPQSRIELDELAELVKAIVNGQDRGFDLVLTNPPFSMGYSMNIDNEKDILEQYVLAGFGMPKGSKRRQSLRSSVMFIERYADLLAAGGRLVTVIDDAILNANKNQYARDFIRQNFIIRAILSLPSDAFQRVGARVKTSVLYLVKRAKGETGQPDVFMYECEHVGMDDVPMKTRLSKATAARKNAEKEVAEVGHAFKLFLAGKRGPWLVGGQLLIDRLDVKSCLPRTNDVSASWRSGGLNVVTLEDVVEPVKEGVIDPRQSPEEEYTLLRVRYDGISEEGERALGGELTYREVWRAKADDLVSSNIAAALGSICVIPPDLEHCLASSEYTIMRLKDRRFDPWFLWGFLRSSEVRARLLSQSTGLARHRVEWDVFKTIPVPVVDSDTQKRLGKKLKESVESVRMAERTRTATVKEMSGLLDLDNEWAVHRLRAAKPPK